MSTVHDAPSLPGEIGPQREGAEPLFIWLLTAPLKLVCEPAASLRVVPVSDGPEWLLEDSAEGVFVDDPDAWLWMALLMLVCAPVVLLAPVPVSVLPDVLVEPWLGGVFVEEPDAWSCTALETLVCAPVVSLESVPVPALPDGEAGWA